MAHEGVSAPVKDPPVAFDRARHHISRYPGMGRLTSVIGADGRL
jgi:hypothetical protein